MSAPDYLAAAALLLAAGGIVFNAGRIREAQARLKEAQAQAKKDSDGLGKKQKDLETEFRRKYLRAIAAAIEAAQTERAKKLFTKLLRED